MKIGGCSAGCLVILAAAGAISVLLEISHEVPPSGKSSTVASAPSNTKAVKKPSVLRRPISGKWREEVSVSEFDDSESVVLTLPGERPVAGWIETSRPSLILRCRERKAEAYIRTGLRANPEYGLYDMFSARVRLDSGVAESVQMGGSTDGNSLFFQDPKVFIGSLLAHRRLVFQFTPFNADPTSTEFDLSGLDRAIERFKDACHL
jgi:hypothetical protein